MDESNVANAVLMALARVEPRITSAAFDPNLSLVDDLGLDSVRFVDLALELEHALALDEFPMQAWSDAEAERASDRFTLRSLIAFCTARVRSV